MARRAERPTVPRRLAIAGTPASHQLRALKQNIQGPGASIVGAVPRLAAAMAAMTGPVALVLDHLELLGSQQSLDAVAELAARLPAGAQLLVASRTAPPLPVALLRAQGQVVELGVEDLALDDQEARALLEGAGVGLDDPAVHELLARTEGWPVGLYLAALAHKAGGSRRHAWAGFTGDDQFMADYLWSELLGQPPPEGVAFLTRTAVLDRMTTTCSRSCRQVPLRVQVGEGANQAQQPHVVVVWAPADSHRRQHEKSATVSHALPGRVVPPLWVIPAHLMKATIASRGLGVPTAAVRPTTRAGGQQTPGHLWAESPWAEVTSAADRKEHTDG